MSVNPLHAPITFDDLSPIEVPVKVQGKDYTLREASGDAACKYRSAVLRCTKMRDGKPSGVDGAIADTEPYLVSLCLWEKYTSKGGEDKERTVRLDIIRGWPARVQAALFERVKAISGLSDAPSTAKMDQPTEGEEGCEDDGEEASSSPHSPSVFPPDNGKRQRNAEGNVRSGMVG